MTCPHKTLKKQLSGSREWYVCAGAWTSVSERIPDFEEPVWGLIQAGKGYSLAIVMRGDGDDGWLWHICNEWAGNMVGWPMDLDNADFECDDDYRVKYWLPLNTLPFVPAECDAPKQNGTPQKFQAVKWDGKVKEVKQ